MTTTLDKKYNKTLVACFIGHVVQAAVNIFVPLLFLQFRAEFGLSTAQITLLISSNFIIQIIVDALAAAYVDKIGYKISAFVSMIAVAAGFFGMAFLPDLLSDPFVGLVICVCIYAVGGGLIEVIISPIVESCPTPDKPTAMSLLHSFYCWGSVAVIGLSTLYFQFVGIQNWRFAIILWGLLPLANAIFFLTVPFLKIVNDDEEKLSMLSLFKTKIFWLFVFVMMLSGASEHSVTQWASTYAESSLGISKTVGDLVGAMFFSVCEGVVRTLYGKWGYKVDIYKTLFISGVLGVCAFVTLGIAPNPAVAIFGMGLGGASVSLMWPGTISIASKYLRRGGTALFAFLALAGDIGCSSGPSLVGFVSQSTGDNLKSGLLCAAIFPLSIAVVYFVFINKKKRENAQKEGKKYVQK